jgi:methylphosphotriester-DNA--protein-cysteine methyltransferase
VKAEPAKPEVAKTAIKPTEAGLVGNKDSKTYHQADCKTAAKMKPANRVTLASKAEAEKQGFKACKVCKP